MNYQRQGFGIGGQLTPAVKNILFANGIICAVSHVLLAGVFSAIVGAVVFWQGLFVGVLAGMAVGGAMAAIVDMVRCAVNWADNQLERAASDSHS